MPPCAGIAVLTPLVVFVERACSCNVPPPLAIEVLPVYVLLPARVTMLEPATDTAERTAAVGNVVVEHETARAGQGDYVRAAAASAEDDIRIKCDRVGRIVGKGLRSRNTAHGEVESIGFAADAERQGPGAGCNRDAAQAQR